MADQNKQETITNDIDLNTSNDNIQVAAEGKENLLEDKNSGDNKSDVNSIYDSTSSIPSTGEAVDKKVTVKDENLEELSDEVKSETNSNNDASNSTPLTSEAVDKKVTVKDENLEELNESKISDEIRNETNPNNDAPNSTPSTGEAVGKKVTVKDENSEELNESKNSDEVKNETNPNNDAPNSTPSTGKAVGKKVTVKDENSEELNESKNSDEIKNETNPNNDAPNSTPSTGKAVDRKVTVKDENSEELNESKNSDEIKNETNSNNDAPNSTPSTGGAVDVAIPVKKKKKKKKKKKSEADVGGLDFHDSGPREEDEDKLYDPSRPLTYRVEVAVQKYKKNRKFSSTRNQVFNSYLRFGGISTGPKSFLGQDGIDNEDADAEEIAARRATDFVDDEKVDDMEVNFTYIVRVYLSSYIIDKSGYVQMDQFREGPQVVISFLNYLFNHKVCPEYEDDMKEALRFANIAKDELPNCKALAQNAPGKFNKACSLLFGGELYGMLDDPWNGEEKVALMIGISKKEAKWLINEVFGPNADEELKRVDKGSRNSFTCEIIEVESFQIDASEVSKNESHNGENSEASDNNPNPQETQETDLKKIILREYDVNTAEPFYIRVGSDVGKYATPGMRITADFHKLSNGFWYWDKVTNVYPSYYLPCEDDSDDDD